jgi:hypothetical protein
MSMQKNDLCYRESRGNLRQSAMRELSQLDFTTSVSDRYPVMTWEQGFDYFEALQTTTQ